MLDKLKQIEEKYVEIESRMESPDVYTDPALYAKYAKEQKELKQVVEAYRQYKSYEDTAQEARQLLDQGVDEPEFKELLREEYDQAKQNMEEMNEKLKILLLPRDPNDEKKRHN